MNSLNKIERTIDYDFHNPDLLQQAFVRRSYSEENGGQNNEVLEFIGDKALDFAVIRIMMDRFGKITEEKEWDEFKLTNPKFFKTKIGEGKFTDLKKQLVQKKALSRCIDALGFHNELIMGKGDEKLNVQESDSVKEDLFEAIVGAVAVDSDYNMDDITRVVDSMIDFEAFFQGQDSVEENYVGMIQEWSQKNGYGLPTYTYEYLKKDNLYRCVIGILDENDNIKYADHANGESKAEARMNAAESLFDALWSSGVIKSEYEEEVGEPSLEESTRQLNELFQKKLISKPEFIFSEAHDNDGNTYWKCKLKVPGSKKTYSHNAYLKKEAQRDCAFHFLCDLMGYDYKEIKEQEERINQILFK